MRVSLRRCSSYDDAAVSQAVAALGEDILGGWQRFIPKGARVLIKPNLLKPATPEQVVCPHPAVVRAIARACLDAGAGRVVIGDSPGLGSARRVAEKSGILQAALELGIEVVEFEDSVTLTTCEQFLHRQFTIAREVAEADIVINLPKFKTHAMMLLTLAVKNLYGVFVGKQKARWHFQCGRDYAHFARMLVELAYSVKPAVSILDAVIGMEGNGPGNGTPRQLGFLGASRDMLSLDLIAAEIAGMEPRRLYTLEAGRSIGFDVAREHITVLGDRVRDFAIQDLQPAARMQVEGPLLLRMLSGIVRRYVTTRPKVNRQRCRGCGICAQACPAQCIRCPQQGTPVTVDDARCIRCFCCQELCPEGAITAHDGPGVRLLKRLRLE
jgi:uncharacterized protein (DUF362 family)/Pyruvate/2-oxoacid:ferredoxin oxidoreductase delta subunit